MSYAGNLTWGLNELKLNTVWQAGLTGKGVRVGLLDTGIDGTHPAFKRGVAQFLKFDQAGFPSAGAGATDCRDHGTHIAGVIGGSQVGEYTIGVAPEVDLVVGMVLEGGNVLARVLAGMHWMLSTGVQVLCLPFGIREKTPVLGTMIAALRARNILVVAPSGNGGAGASVVPSSYPGVLSVGACDQNYRVTRFSGSLHRRFSGECLKPDLIAPGEGIWSAVPGGQLSQRSGTSMACAHVAGVACLLWQQNPGASAAAIAQALIATSTPLPTGQAYRSRHGFLNPPAALDYLLHNGHIQTDTLTESIDTEFFPNYSAKEEITHFVDPHLQNLLKYTADHQYLEAIFVTADKETMTNDRRGLTEAIIDRVGRLIDQKYSRVRYMPEAHLVIVKATARFIRSMMNQPEVIIASATDLDFFR